MTALRDDMHTPDFSPAQLPAALRNLYIEWDNRAEAGFPRLSAGLFQDLTGSLNRVALTEILHDTHGRPCDFRLIYLSAALRSKMSHDFTGMRFSEEPGKGPGTDIWRAYAAICRTGLPHRVNLPYEGPAQEYDTTTELFVPLANELGRLTYIMAGVLLNPVAETVPPWAIRTSKTVPPGSRLT